MYWPRCYKTKKIKGYKFISVKGGEIMLGKPSLMKVPDASYSVWDYNDPACSGYGAAGCKNKTFTCSPYGSNGAGCIDAQYSQPANGGCSWTLGVGVVGAGATIAIGVIGIIATPT